MNNLPDLIWQLGITIALACMLTLIATQEKLPDCELGEWQNVCIEYGEPTIERKCQWVDFADGSVKSVCGDVKMPGVCILEAVVCGINENA